MGRRAHTGRDTARRVLSRVRRDGAYASLTLSAALDRSAAMSALERTLATELVYGVLRNQRWLDHALSHHVKRPLARVHPEVLDCLRLAAYQILLLDRVPDYAAVDDAVGHVRRLKGRALSGFVNAVLRKLTPGDLERGMPADPGRRLAVERSVPDEIASSWIEQLGLQDADELAAAMLGRAPLTIRSNAVKTNAEALVRAIEHEGGQATPCRWSPSALQLTGVPRPFSSKSYRDGLWTVQDEGAQLPALQLAPEPGDRVLDACAGIGGKSTQLATMVGEGGRVICVDRSQRKLELLRQHCRRLAIDRCDVMKADLGLAGALGGLEVDRALLDAPCSGLGVLRRHPELKWRPPTLPERLPELVALQRRLLEQVAGAVRPGGVLVYSVCTTTEEEGPAQIRWFLERHPDFEPQAGLVDLPGPPGAPGALRLWPHRHGTDGFFIARIARTPDKT